MIEDLLQQYHAIRQQTLSLCNGLTIEDMAAQSMPDASPSKWHLGHTTWFFETFLLQAHQPKYQTFNPQFAHLFNSYYQSVGTPYLRPQRGFLTRPSLEEVKNYREHVDAAMNTLLDNNDKQITDITTVGLHHEMQHQELLLTDVLHLLAHNPLHPRIKTPHTQPDASQVKQFTSDKKLTFTKFDAQKIEVGADNPGFSYDCEKPRHTTWLTPFSLANRLITNREWLAFMQDDGYKCAQLWLSDGWACIQKQQWLTPLYWHEVNGQWFQFGLDGLQPLRLDAPVCHISYYEADAFARWAGKRLPREHELEVCQSQTAIHGNFLEQQLWRPQPANWLSDLAPKPSSKNITTTLHPDTQQLTQVYGDVWQWTQSAFTPYPNFKPENGALGEYNGKFMANQFVLKGGSCVTPIAQMRPTYRNFFYPHQRWQFTGLRLAEDN